MKYVYCGVWYDECNCNSDYACRCTKVQESMIFQGSPEEASEMIAEAQKKWREAKDAKNKARREARAKAREA